MRTHGPAAAARAAHAGRAAAHLRRFIDRQVGGIEKLLVPATDADLPQPLGADGRPDPFFETTKA
jgi:hypothetical protein